MAEKISEKEVLARKDARKEGDGSHATSSCGQSVKEEGEKGESHATSSRGQLVNEVKENGGKDMSPASSKPQWLEICLGSLSDELIDQKMAQNDEPSHRPRIVKVKPSLRESLWDRVEPEELSFGPIHYGVEKLRSGEAVKKKLAAFYFQVNGRNKYIDRYSRLKEEVLSLQQCYDMDTEEWGRFCTKYRNGNKYLFTNLSDSDTPSDNEIISWMFMVDGCALLSWIALQRRSYPWRYWNWDSELELSELPKSSRTDIFLPENQLPSKLLVTLMDANDLLVKPDDVNGFLDKCCFKLWKVKLTGRPHIEDSSHLLHLLWLKMRILFTQPGDSFCHRNWILKHGKEHLDSPPSHKIQELKKVGIELKAVGSTKSQQFGFKMGWLFPELRLLKFDIDGSAATMLSSLMAFEIDPQFSCDLEVTSYIAFLNSLVANTRDIAELRSAKILYRPRDDDDAFELLRGLAFKFLPRLNASSLCKWQIHKYLKEHKTRIKISIWLRKNINQDQNLHQVK